MDKGSFSEPIRSVDLSGMGTVEFVEVGGLKVSRLTFRPGWRWTLHAKPIVGGDSCQTHHYGFVTAGHLVVRMNDGSQDEYGPGDVWIIPPGHDAWVVGGESVVALEFPPPSAT